jgi:hypothetical protein
MIREDETNDNGEPLYPLHLLELVYSNDEFINSNEEVNNDPDDNIPLVINNNEVNNEPEDDIPLVINNNEVYNANNN